MNMEEILGRIDQLFSQNKGQEAEALMHQSIKEAMEQQEDGALLQLLNELLGYYRETSQVEASYEVGQKAVSLAVSMGLEHSIPYATTLLNVANAYRAGGRLEDSLSYYRKVQELYREILEPDNLLNASLDNNMSLLYQELGQYEAAKECLLRALPIVTQKKMGYEIAVTYANLGNTCLQLGEQEEAYAYIEKALQLFEENGDIDSHYASALAARGTLLMQRGQLSRAAEDFQLAMKLMEESLGRNQFYYRLKEYWETCTKQEPKGMELSRQYYLEYGQPMIHEQFQEYESRIAVGLAGEGSDCFGLDDGYSRDHDWGPGFCMWLTREDFEKIGEALQKAYENLPEDFHGIARKPINATGKRHGVFAMEEWFKGLVGASCYDQVDFSATPDYALAAVSNGEIFRDDAGMFTESWQQFRAGYPLAVQYVKLAEGCARFSQGCQYNIRRMLQRDDEVTAQLCLSDGLKEAMKIMYYMENVYPLHDKWLFSGLQRLSCGKQLRKRIKAIYESSFGRQYSKMYQELEELGAFLANALYQKHFISDVDAYLEHHAGELLCKSQYAGLETIEDLAMETARMEFQAFDQVKNEGGRADCQNNWATFSIMRRSQYLTWSREMLLQYLYDFKRELGKGHNLITEKYGRMMKSTAPERYAELEPYFPELSEEKTSIIEEIVKIQVQWMEAFAQEYPTLATQARSIHTYEDHKYNTSYETYLRGEISTYSDKMLELYGRYIVEHLREGKNLAYEIMENSTSLYGYKSLAAAEAFMSL